MKETSKEEIEIELGKWQDGIRPEFINVIYIESSDYITESSDIINNRFVLFARPNGFQLSTISRLTNYSILYSDIKRVSLLKAKQFLYYKSINFLIVLLFGFIFFILGGLIGKSSLGVIWLPIGLVFGLLYSMNKERKRVFQKIEIEYNDSSKIYYSINSNDKIEVINFFINHLNDKFVS
jgi:hypothetical protein